MAGDAERLAPASIQRIHDLMVHASPTDPAGGFQYDGPSWFDITRDDGERSDRLLPQGSPVAVVRTRRSRSSRSRNEPTLVPPRVMPGEDSAEVPLMDSLRTGSAHSMRSGREDGGPLPRVHGPGGVPTATLPEELRSLRYVSRPRRTLGISALYHQAEGDHELQSRRRDHRVLAALEREAGKTGPPGTGGPSQQSNQSASSSWRRHEDADAEGARYRVRKNSVAFARSTEEHFMLPPSQRGPFRLSASVPALPAYGRGLRSPHPSARETAGPAGHLQFPEAPASRERVPAPTQSPASGSGAKPFSFSAWRRQRASQGAAPAWAKGSSQPEADGAAESESGGPVTGSSPVGRDADGGNAVEEEEEEKEGEEEEKEREDDGTGVPRLHVPTDAHRFLESLLGVARAQVEAAVASDWVRLYAAFAHAPTGPDVVSIHRLHRAVTAGYAPYTPGDAARLLRRLVDRAVPPNPPAAAAGLDADTIAERFGDGMVSREAFRGEFSEAEATARAALGLAPASAGDPERDLPRYTAAMVNVDCVLEHVAPDMVASVGEGPAFRRRLARILVERPSLFVPEVVGLVQQSAAIDLARTARGFLGRLRARQATVARMAQRNEGRWMARCFHAWLAYTRRVWALRRHCARKLLVWHRHTRALCAARYRFRVMFWPFYVWAREVGQVVVARAKARFLHAVWDTYVQLHSLRQWRAMARRRGRLRARAGRVIHRRLWHVAHRCLRCLAAYRAERIAKRRLWWEQGAVLRRMLDQRLLARCMVLLRVHAAGWQSARELPRRLAHAYTRHDQLRADHALSWLPQPPSAAEAYPWAPTVAATACLRATKAPVEGMRAYFHRELRGRVLVHASILRRVGPRCLAALRRHAVFQKQERFSAHLGALAIMRRSFRRLFLGARHRPLLRLRLSEEQQAELARKDREAKTRVRRAQESGADERSNDDLAWERQRKRHQVAAASARDLARSLRAARSRAATESAASEGHNAVVSQRVSAMRRARERVVGQVGAEAAEAGRALRQEAEALMHERGEALVEALYRVKAAMDDAYTREVAAAAFTELRWKVLHRRASRHATRCKLRRWLALCAQLRRLDRSMPRYYRLRLKWRHFRAWLRFVRARYAVLPVGLRQRAVRLRGHALAFSKLLDAGADPSSASTDLQLLFSRWEEAAAMSAAHRAVVSLCTARRERRLTRRVLWCWNTGTRPYAHYARRRAVEDEHDSRLRRWWLTLDLWHTLMLRRTRTRTSRWMQRCNAFVRTKMIQRTRRVFTLKHMLLRHKQASEARIRLERKLLFAAFNDLHNRLWRDSSGAEVAGVGETGAPFQDPALPPGVRVRGVELWHSPSGVNALRLVLQGPSVDSGDGRSKTTLAPATQDGGRAAEDKGSSAPAADSPVLHVLSTASAAGGQCVYATPWHGDLSGEQARFDLDFKPRRASRPAQRAARTVRIAREGGAAAWISAEEADAARAVLAEEGVDEQTLDAKGWFPGEVLAGVDACVGRDRIQGLRFRTTYNRMSQWYGNTETGQVVELGVPEGEHMVGFAGSASMRGVHSLCLRTRRPLRRNVLASCWPARTMPWWDAGDWEVAHLEFAAMLRMRSCDLQNALERAHDLSSRVRSEEFGAPAALAESALVCRGLGAWLFQALSRGLVCSGEGLEARRKEERGTGLLAEAQALQQRGEEEEEAATVAMAAVRGYDPARDAITAQKEEIGPAEYAALKRRVARERAKRSGARHLMARASTLSAEAHRLLPHLADTWMTRQYFFELYTLARSMASLSNDVDAMTAPVGGAADAAAARRQARASRRSKWGTFGDKAKKQKRELKRVDLTQLGYRTAPQVGAVVAMGADEGLKTQLAGKNGACIGPEQQQQGQEQGEQEKEKERAAQPKSHVLAAPAPAPSTAEGRLLEEMERRAWGTGRPPPGDATLGRSGAAPSPKGGRPPVTSPPSQRQRAGPGAGAFDPRSNVADFVGALDALTEREAARRYASPPRIPVAWSLAKRGPSATGQARHQLQDASPWGTEELR